MCRVPSLPLLVIFLLALLCPALTTARQWNSYYDMGVYAFEERKFYISQSHFLKALKKNPDNEYCNYYLGRICLNTGRYDEAAAFLDSAHKKNQDIPGLKFDIALLKFKTGAFKDAAALFKQLTSETPKDTLVVYYAGMSLFRQEKYAEALLFFTDAAGSNFSIQANSYYYSGICLKNLDRLDEAAEKLTFVAQNADSDLLKRNAKKQLQLIRQKKAYNKPFRLHFQTGFGYDSNVRLESLDDKIYSSDADRVAEAYLYGGYYFIRQKRWQAGAGAGHHQTWHKKLDEYDSSGTTANFHVSGFFHPIAVKLTCSPSIYFVDTEKFMTRHTIRPNLIWTIDKTLTAAFSLGYSDNTYHTIDGRDGRSTELSAEIKRGFFENKADASFCIGHEDTSASVSYFGYTRLKSGLRFSIELPVDVTLNLTGKFSQKTHDDTHPYYAKRRKDTYHSGSLVLTRGFLYNRMTVSAKLNYEKTNSNIDDFAYKRNFTGIFISADY